MIDELNSVFNGHWAKSVAVEHCVGTRSLWWWWLTKRVKCTTTASGRQTVLYRRRERETEERLTDACWSPRTTRRGRHRAQWERERLKRKVGEGGGRRNEWERSQICPSALGQYWAECNFRCTRVCLSLTWSARQGVRPHRQMIARRETLRAHLLMFTFLLWVRSQWVPLAGFALPSLLFSSSLFATLCSSAVFHLFWSSSKMTANYPITSALATER